MLVRRTLFALCFGALAALALTSAAAPLTSTRTVVTGTVMLDPASPVCYVGEPCSKPAAGFKLEFSRRGRVVRTETNSLGRYRILLSPGIYRVKSPGGGSVGSGLYPRRIFVPAGRRAVRNFTYDGGIR